MSDGKPRINVSMSKVDQALLDRVGVELHKDGIPGMLNFDGEVVRAAVLRYILREKAKAFGLTKQQATETELT